MNFISKEPIYKGWSNDKKYCVTGENGQRYLQRVSDISEREAKRAEFRMMERVAALGVPMCLPVEFGECGEGVYSLQSWIEGDDLEAVIGSYSRGEQYAYGLEAGEILRKIHSIPAPEGIEDWESRFNRKMDLKIQKYMECPLKYEKGQAFIDYIAENRHLLHGRPQSYQHGDYHTGNMMLDRSGKLHIIDFNRNDYGDPWEEFNRIVWCAQSAPWFATGMVNGYFENAVPMEFWRLLALYISSNSLSSLYWAIPFGQGEVDTMRRQAREVLEWYDGMRNPVPGWYKMELRCVDRKPDIRAMITLTRDNPVYSGYRPAHLIGNYLTSGIQRYIGTDMLRHGETVEAYINFITPEAYPHSLKAGMRIAFQEGERMTGYADILEIYNELLMM